MSELATNCPDGRNISKFAGVYMYMTTNRLKIWLILIASIVLASQSGSTQRTVTFVDGMRDFPGPQVFKDPHSGTLLYVETDGRHVAAISSDGKLLWNKDPFKDAHLEFYRTNTPQIVHMGPTTAWGETPGINLHGCVIITFNSSQFGALRISNGDFQILGQN